MTEETPGLTPASETGPLTPEQIAATEEALTMAKEDLAAYLDVLGFETKEHMMPHLRQIFEKKNDHPAFFAATVGAMNADNLVVALQGTLQLAHASGDGAVLRNAFGHLAAKFAEASQSFDEEHPCCDGSCGHHPRRTMEEVGKTSMAWADKTMRATQMAQIKLVQCSLEMACRLTDAAEAEGALDKVEADLATAEPITFTMKPKGA